MFIIIVVNVTCIYSGYLPISFPLISKPLNGQKWLVMMTEVVGDGQKWSGVVGNGQRQSEMVENIWKWSETVGNFALCKLYI